MTTADGIIVAIIVLILALIIGYSIYRKKKGDNQCSHCPSRKTCQPTANPEEEKCSGKCDSCKDCSGRSPIIVSNQDVDTTQEVAKDVERIKEDNSKTSH